MYLGGRTCAALPFPIWNKIFIYLFIYNIDNNNSNSNDNNNNNNNSNKLIKMMIIVLFVDCYLYYFFYCCNFYNLRNYFVKIIFNITLHLTIVAKQNIEKADKQIASCIYWHDYIARNDYEIVIKQLNN